MTESDAYKRLGWAPAGGAPNPFVLPLSGSASDEWCITLCQSCGMEGVSLPHILDEGCCCGKPWTYIIR